MSHPVPPAPASLPQTPYDREAIYDRNGPIDPTFMSEAIRALMRTLPLNTAEPGGWASRRGHSAMRALSALHPRDEIEVMIGVQALSAYHAAAACWHIGMNLRHPNGDSTRHISTAASAARTFDSLLKAIERRQVKPLAIPAGRPPSREWAPADVAGTMRKMEARCREGDDDLDDDPTRDPSLAWTPEALAIADEYREQERLESENEGLDIANTEGILPGGGMIMPEHPTPQQEAYMARRLALMYRREIAENRRKGITKLPKIRGVRPGDLIP